MAKDRFGLRELPKDNRDFPLGALFGVLPLDQLPEEFELTTPFPIKNQGNTDYCSAYASCGLSELQEQVELYPEWSFACSKEISGNHDAWGQDLRSAVKAHTKYGGMPVEHTSEGQNGDLRRLSSYPDEYLTIAQKHLKSSYFRVDGSYDSFDNIRAAIYKHRNDKQGVIIGVIWSWNTSDYVLKNPQDTGWGHAVYITGWNKEGLIMVNSYGESAGKNGKHILTREVVNAFVPRFGAYMLVDMPADEAQDLIARREWVLAGFFGKLYILIRNWWRDIWL